MPISFPVVELNFPYNAIMGLLLINKLKAVISPHQLLLQFEQDDGKVGILGGESSMRKREEDKNQSIMSVYLDTLNT